MSKLDLFGAWTGSTAFAAKTTAQSVFGATAVSMAASACGAGGDKKPSACGAGGDKKPGACGAGGDKKPGAGGK